MDKILWIDDKYDELDSIKDVLESPKYNFEVVPCKYAIEGMQIFTKGLEEWAAVILDAQMLMQDGSDAPALTGLTHCVQEISKAAYKRYVPYFILTGEIGEGNDKINRQTFSQLYPKYYEKDKDEDRLFADIQAAAESIEETHLRHKYQTIFDYWTQSDHDLLRILKVLEKEDWTNNSVLNDIRKIMSDVMNRLFEIGLCNVKHDGSNLAECSKMLGNRCMTQLIPVYVQRAIHLCVEVTNPGSHRTLVDADVAKGQAPYLVRSLIYEMLTILHWCVAFDAANSDYDLNSQKVIAIFAEQEQKKKKTTE